MVTPPPTGSVGAALSETDDVRPCGHSADYSGDDCQYGPGSGADGLVRQRHGTGGS